MSTLTVADLYPGQAPAGSPAPLETASAGGPAMSSTKLPLTAWIAFVVALLAVRLLWEYSG